MTSNSVFDTDTQDDKWDKQTNEIVEEIFEWRYYEQEVLLGDLSSLTTVRVTQETEFLKGILNKYRNMIIDGIEQNIIASIKKSLQETKSKVKDCDLAKTKPELVICEKPKPELIICEEHHKTREDYERCKAESVKRHKYNQPPAPRAPIHSQWYPGYNPNANYDSEI